MKVFKFHFYFCLQYVLSHIISLYVFDISFLKIIPKMLFLGLLYLLFFIISKQNGCSFPILRLSLYSPCSCNLCHIHCQCLPQCKLNVKHSNQHSQRPENGPNIARNSEARWKLFKNIKTDDSSFKRERIRVDQKKRLREKLRRRIRLIHQVIHHAEVILILLLKTMFIRKYLYILVLLSIYGD